MKKLLSFSIALALVFALAGCGEQSESSAGQSASGGSGSADFPSHAIEVHTFAGSTVEVNTRLFTSVLSKYLNNENILVVGDGSFYEAMQNAINAEPDGYYLSATTCNVQLTDAQGGLGYDSVEDGRFIGTFTVGGGYYVALTTEFANEHNIHSFDELVAFTQKYPNEYTISTSYGAISELATYSLIDDCGVAAYPVDLADSNTRLIAFIEGDLDIFVGNYSTIEQYVQTGEVEVLCYYGDERSVFQPDIPCTKELGYSVRPASNYYYLTCAKDTPDEVVEILTNAVEQAVKDPEYIEAIRNNDAEEYFLNSEDTYKLLTDMRESLRTLFE